MKPHERKVVIGAGLRNEHSVLTVSVLLDGEYGIHNVCPGVPCLVSDQGIERVIESAPPDAEQNRLRHSASVLQDAWNQLRGGFQS